MTHHKKAHMAPWANPLVIINFLESRHGYRVGIN